MTDTPGSLEERRGSANAPVPETMEGLRAQNRAYRTLCASLEAQMATLTAKGREYHEAVTTLDSEREANAILTDEIASLRARVEALETALVSEREENLWHAYHSGFVRNGEWDHMCMSDGEWLAMECGFNVNDRRIADADIRAAIPQAARQALKDTPVE